MSRSVAVVAEDEVLVRMVAADMLEEAGFQVAEAGDAQGALDHLASHPNVTLLFTDIEMPGSMNGIALAQEVARRWPHIVLMVCSGRVRPAAGTLPPQAHFIGKPYTMALMQEILTERGLLPGGSHMSS
uniref:response regulator n=1 Tax=Methylobacterium sp. NMS12 TaxID=3079766 RepID=UPI003F885761